MKKIKFPLDNLIVLIPKKQDQSITAQELAVMIDSNESFIRKKINEARAMGIPICSTQYGYYLSDDNNDIAAMIQFLTTRINTQLEAIRGLKNRIEKKYTEEGK